jgi:hypothetical protein
VLGLLVFGFADSGVQFVCGTVLYGVYTASMFNYMMYHSWLDPNKAVKRVAINEALIGCCMVVGPIAAALLRSRDLPFPTVYVIVAAGLTIAIAAQTLVAKRLLAPGDGLGQHAESLT